MLLEECYRLFYQISSYQQDTSMNVGGWGKRRKESGNHYSHDKHLPIILSFPSLLDYFTQVLGIIITGFGGIIIIIISPIFL